jgi:hypothetical protein
MQGVRRGRFFRFNGPKSGRSGARLLLESLGHRRRQIYRLELIRWLPSNDARAGRDALRPVSTIERSNNDGMHEVPEKLIPLMILRGAGSSGVTPFRVVPTDVRCVWADKGYAGAPRQAWLREQRIAGRIMMPKGPLKSADVIQGNCNRPPLMESLIVSMNTILSLPRVALMALALGTAGVTATFAQTTTTPSTTTTPPADTNGGWHHHGRGHHHDSVLSATEKAQLKKAKETALASNPSLKTQHDALKAQFEALKNANPPATKAHFEALHQQKEQLHQQMRAAELAADPTLGPILQKLDAAHQGHGHHHHSQTSTT